MPVEKAFPLPHRIRCGCGKRTQSRLARGELCWDRDKGPGLLGSGHDPSRPVFGVRRSFPVFEAHTLPCYLRRCINPVIFLWQMARLVSDDQTGFGGRHLRELEVACAFVLKSRRAGSRPCGRSRWHSCGLRRERRRKGGAFRFFRSGSLRRCTAGSAAWRYALRARAPISRRPNVCATRSSIARWPPSPTPEPCTRSATRINTTPCAIISWSSTSPSSGRGGARG